MGLFFSSYPVRFAVRTVLLRRISTALKQCEQVSSRDAITAHLQL